MDEFHAHAARADLFARVDANELRLLFIAVLRQLVAQNAERQPRCVYRHIQLLENIGHGADMVLMPVGEKNAAHLFFVLFQIGYIRDHKIDAGHLLIRESHAAIHNDNIVSVFDCRDIFSDFTDSPERNHLKLSRRFSSCHSFIPFFFKSCAKLRKTRRR